MNISECFERSRKLWQQLHTTHTITLHVCVCHNSIDWSRRNSLPTWRDTRWPYLWTFYNLRFFKSTDSNKEQTTFKISISWSLYLVKYLIWWVWLYMNHMLNLLLRLLLNYFLIDKMESSRQLVEANRETVKHLLQYCWCTFKKLEINEWIILMNGSYPHRRIRYHCDSYRLTLKGTY